MEYLFKKSTCDRYDIRLKDSYGWAIITIDENGGLFNAQSDYGAYSYSWPNHGWRSFKQFILELVRDKSYFLGKVAESNYYYADRTEKIFKEEVIRARRDGELTENEARELWNEIIDFDYCCKETLDIKVYESEVISKYYDCPWEGFESVTGFSPQAIQFFDVIMPILGEIIKNELETKKTA